jgi:integrase
MQAKSKRGTLPQGIRVRHSRTCATRAAGCRCEKSYEAFVYLKGEGRKVRKTFPTLAAAKAWRADATVAANRGKLRAPSSETVREAWEAWLARARAGHEPNRSGNPYKPAALRGYERSMRLRVLPAFGHVKLSAVPRADVQAFADRLTDDGASASTVQNTLDPLRVLFRRALRRDLIAVDPTDGLELRRKRGKRDRIAPPAEAAALLAALPDEDRALWATAFYGGLRRGELRALRWTDVDLDARRIRVEREWDDHEGELDEAKSEAGRRTVPLVPQLVVELRAHLLRTGRRGDALVFGRTDTEPFIPTTVRSRALRAWAAENARRTREAEEAGVEPELLTAISLHEGRHTCASTFIAAGASPKAIQSLMGHATIQMTFDQYGHLFPDDLDAAAELAGAFIDRAVAAG